MFEWTIFSVGLFTSLLLIAGLFFTVREFRDIAKHPERHESNDHPRRKGAELRPRPNALKGYLET